jgi:hypothetical protein
VIRGRNVEEMTADERLDALAAILAIGFEKWARNEQIELAEVRLAMAPCVHPVNGQRPANGDQS